MWCPVPQRVCQGCVERTGDHGCRVEADAEHVPDHRGGVVQVRRADLDRGHVPDDALAQQCEAGGVAGHEQVLLGDLHLPARADGVPQVAQALDGGCGRGLGQHAQSQLDGFLRRLGRDRPGHRRHHELRLLCRDEVGEGAERRDAPLRLDLFTALGRAGHHAGDGQVLGRHAGQAQEELCSPATADDTEPDRCRVAHHSHSSRGAASGCSSAHSSSGTSQVA
jgi:hypothetical protein